MRALFKNSIYLVLALFVAGTAVNVSAAEEGAACVGSVTTPPEGLAEVDDPTLLQAALGETGKGKLCTGKTFVAEKPVTVYRVWDGSKSYTALGSWWSFSPPEGPRDSYQKANIICPGWSALNRMSACRLKVGAHIAVGPGQSAQCPEGLYAQSAVNQVYIPNDTRKGQVFVDNCSTPVDWPAATQ